MPFVSYVKLNLLKMKTVKLILILFFAMISVKGFSQNSGFYDFKVKTLDGKDFDFSTLKGKKVMIVNTASKCGYTPQYKEKRIVVQLR